MKTNMPVVSGLILLVMQTPVDGTVEYTDLTLAQGNKSSNPDLGIQVFE